MCLWSAKRYWSFSDFRVKECWWRRMMPGTFECTILRITRGRRWLWREWRIREEFGCWACITSNLFTGELLNSTLIQSCSPDSQSRQADSVPALHCRTHKECANTHSSCSNDSASTMKRAVHDCGAHWNTAATKSTQATVKTFQQSWRQRKSPDTTINSILSSLSLLSFTLKIPELIKRHSLLSKRLSGPLTLEKPSLIFLIVLSKEDWPSNWKFTFKKRKRNFSMRLCKDSNWKTLKFRRRGPSSPRAVTTRLTGRKTTIFRPFLHWTLLKWYFFHLLRAKYQTLTVCRSDQP